MNKIKEIRPVLLSAPYADISTNAEVLLHLPSGFRTCGMVEIILEDGTTGLGEGYLPVFAPQVFVALIDLARPYLIGRDPLQINEIYADLQIVYGYWSMQGAAMHALSAVEIALQDCRAKLLGVPVYKMLGGTLKPSLDLYASGGDSLQPEGMTREFARIEELGIQAFKIRARKELQNKAIWCLREGQRRGISVAIDMGLNLQNPGHSVDDVIAFEVTAQSQSGTSIFFLEEVLGPTRSLEYPLLRQKLNVPLAGGEIITTPYEFGQRLAMGCYDIAQPDATVLGGIGALMEVFQYARLHPADVVVHCWGGPVGMLANYHAAVAAGGKMGEWPLPHFPLREALGTSSWHIENVQIHLSDEPGLGVRLTPEIERAYAFRPEAVYQCKVDRAKLPPNTVWE